MTESAVFMKCKSGGRRKLRSYMQHQLSGRTCVVDA